MIKLALIMGPWILVLSSLWFLTNLSDPEKPLVELKRGLLLITIGLMLFILGIVLRDIDIGVNEIVDLECLNIQYTVLSMILVYYGYFGQKYRLVKSKR